ncbi:MAG: hypothetical protein N4A49_02050 [Marinifilaceae bacterium]|jgi:hypothetical protein|nr:hypothetical protein [Marinifilaceae bacterium]
MKKIIIIPILLLLFACSKKENNFEKKFTELNEFPIQLDKSFFKLNHNEKKDLTIDEVKILYKNIQHINSDDAYKYSLAELFKIDSLIKNNQLKDYHKWTLKNTKLKAISKFKTNSNTECFIWYMYYPVDMNQDEKFVFLSVKNNKNSFNCIQVSKFKDYSDAPIWTEERVYSVISKEGNIKLNTTRVYGEDETIEDKSEKSFMLKINKDAGMDIISKETES